MTTISNATEGGTPGIFRVCRTGSTAAPLSIPFTFSGNAVENVDFTYAPTGNPLTIPASQACLDLVVTVIDDLITNGTRTLTITLNPSNPVVVLPGPAIAPTVVVVPGQGSATMTLIDNEAPPIVQNIPTMNTMGLILLSLLLVGSAGFVARRRR